MVGLPSITPNRASFALHLIESEGADGLGFTFRREARIQGRRLCVDVSVTFQAARWFIVRLGHVAGMEGV